MTSRRPVGVSILAPKTGYCLKTAGGSLELSAELLMIIVLVSLGYFKTGATQPSASTHGCLASYACPPCRCAVFTLKAPLVGAPEQVWHSLANLVRCQLIAFPIDGYFRHRNSSPLVLDHARVITAALLVAKRNWVWMV
jgi:hypothetical protein